MSYVWIRCINLDFYKQYNHHFSILGSIFLERLLWDITITDWLAAISYFIPALFSGIYIIRAKNIVAKNEIFSHQILWWSITLILILLGIYRFFDFHILVAEFGRNLSKHQQWYERRFTFQLIFVFFVGLFCMLLLCFSESKIPILWRCYRLTICSIIYLICLVIIGTTSYHPIDMVFNNSIMGIRISWILELIGIVFFVISLVINLHRNATKVVSFNNVSGTKYI